MKDLKEAYKTIEAKAEENRQAKALKAYRERFNPRFAVRIRPSAPE